MKLTRRQKRELLLLIFAIVLGAILGFAVRAYLQKGNSVSSGKSFPGGHPPFNGTSSQVSVSPIEPDKVIAIVDSKEILGKELNKYVKFYLGAGGLTEENLTPNQILFFRRLALNDLIEQPILEKIGKEQALSVSEVELDEFIQRAKEPFSSEKEFLDDLSNTLGLTLSEFREVAGRMLLREKLVEATEVDAQISEEELDAQMEKLSRMMENHPGGKVALPSKEELRAQMIQERKRFSFDLFLSKEKEKHNIKILDPTLEAPPLTNPSSSENPHELAPTAKPVPH